MKYFFDIKPGEPEVILYGACEGGHCASVVSAEDIGSQAALVLIENESKLTGWEFTTAGKRNDAGQFVWSAIRRDGATCSKA